MSLQIHHVDAFTDRPFTGNPAAVCVLQAPRDEGRTQRAGAELVSGSP